MLLATGTIAKGNFAMRLAVLIPAALMLPQSACAWDGSSDNGQEASETVADEDIFEAAGFKLTGGQWRKCGDPGTVSYEPGAISQRGDFNGDGQPDALVTESGTYCFGMAGSGYTLVTKDKDGGWRILDERIGLPMFLETSGAEGWPDIQVGGPGFCFPVLRWNGSKYALDRTEYEGAPC